MRAGFRGKTLSGAVERSPAPASPAPGAPAIATGDGAAVSPGACDTGDAAGCGAGPSVDLGACATAPMVDAALTPCAASSTATSFSTGRSPSAAAIPPSTCCGASRAACPAAPPPEENALIGRARRLLAMLRGHGRADPPRRLPQGHGPGGGRGRPARPPPRRPSWRRARTSGARSPGLLRGAGRNPLGPAGGARHEART